MTRSALAMRRHGVPAEILTDNGKVFTGRFGPGTGEVLFDRICRENGIKHILDRAAVADHDRQDRAVAQDAARRVPDRQGVRLDRRRAGPARRVGRALQPRPPAPVARDGDAVGPVQARRPRTATAPAIELDCGSCRVDAGVGDTAGRREGARSVSPRRTTRPGCGSPARTSRWSATAGWCRSTTAVCSSPPTPAGTIRPSSRPG